MTTGWPPEAEVIADAIDVLFGQIAEAAQQRPRGTPLNAQSIAEYLATYDDRSEDGQDAIDILDDPLGWGPRRAIEVLGRRLFELGGTNLMLQVLEEVSGRDSDHYAHRADLIDKTWDTIGNQEDGWVA